MQRVLRVCVYVCVCMCCVAMCVCVCVYACVCVCVHMCIVCALVLAFRTVMYCRCNMALELSNEPPSLPFSPQKAHCVTWLRSWRMEVGQSVRQVRGEREESRSRRGRREEGGMEGVGLW